MTPVDSSQSPSLEAAIAYLRSPQGIRDRCSTLLKLALDGSLTHFQCDLERLDVVADYVIQVMREQYPSGDVPFHSRWRHFEIGDPQRLRLLDDAGLSPLEQARARVDLAVTSVLLDAGAGPTWRYVEPESGRVLQRSEGLAIASFHWFCQGGLSSDPAHPLQADAVGLQAVTPEALTDAFQVSETNPLVGLSGRVGLLQQLGQVLAAHPDYFGQPARPGHLVDYLQGQAEAGAIAATAVLQVVLDGLSDIWPGRITLNHTNLGDVWPHPALPQTHPGSDLVPFHKLSQWLTYSLLEPLQALGLTILDINHLTGLPEYRNGGLLLDLGLLQPKHPAVTQHRHAPGSEVIVEWRALTVALLDQVAEAMRRRLGLTAAQLPLAKVLEGGTWSAGRRIAASLRPGGLPPIQIESDGTVF
ncbi:MAG: URC4/urg3 family protein [Synechococcales bacterium]|nr:URC4/urg3 family protein [Synechococcales bacterium]